MTLRTLEELNRDYMSGCSVNRDKTGYEPITPLVIHVEPPKTGKAQSKGRREPKPRTQKETQPERRKAYSLLATISDALFSLAIVMILVVALFPGPDGTAPKRILNYSYFTVMTPSMQDEIPQGSLILVKKIDPLKLKEGDNITFLAEHGTSVTHKIVGIHENFGHSGARGFQTQGVNNANPDGEIVYEANVIGKVVLVLPLVGKILSGIGENFFLLFLIFSLCILLSFFLRGVWTKPFRWFAKKEAEV